MLLTGFAVTPLDPCDSAALQRSCTRGEHACKAQGHTSAYLCNRCQNAVYMQSYVRYPAGNVWHRNVHMHGS